MSDDLAAQVHAPTLELEVMTAVAAALERLPSADARRRVLAWATDAFAGPRSAVVAIGDSDTSTTEASVATLAGLLEATAPSSRSDCLLTVAYWLQVEQGNAKLDIPGRRSTTS